MAGADDFNTIREDEDADGGTNEVVPMDEGIDHEFFEDTSGDFGFAQGVDTATGLNLTEIAHDEAHGSIELGW